MGMHVKFVSSLATGSLISCCVMPAGSSRRLALSERVTRPGAPGNAFPAASRANGAVFFQGDGACRPALPNPFRIHGGGEGAFGKMERRK